MCRGVRISDSKMNKGGRSRPRRRDVYFGSAAGWRKVGNGVEGASWGQDVIQTGMTVVTGGFKEGTNRHRGRLVDAWARGIVVGRFWVDQLVGCRGGE